VAVYWTHAYGMNRIARKLYVVDVSDPSAIALEDSIILPHCPEQIQVSGDHLYVAEDHGGLVIFEVSDSGKPTWVATHATAGDAKALHVVGDLAYIGAGSMLEIIDVSDPSKPHIIGGLGPGVLEYIADVYVEGGRAYVKAAPWGLLIVDVGDPAAPGIIGHLSMPMNLVAIGGHRGCAYVSHTGLNGFEIVAADLPAPPLYGSYDHEEFYGCRAAVAGELIYAANACGMLEILDFADPDAPFLLGRLPLPQGPLGIEVSGDHAYIGSYNQGVIVVAIGDPATPEQVAFFPLPDVPVIDLCVADDRLYIPNGDSGVLIVDVADPSAPIQLGMFCNYESPVDVKVVGGLAYLANRSNSMDVVDVSDPASPQLLARLELENNGRQIELVGDLAYVLASYGGGLCIVDVATPSAPALLGNVAQPSTGDQLLVKGAVAYSAQGAHGLRVIDVSDPTAPVELGACFPAAACDGVALLGSRLIMGCRDDGLILGHVQCGTLSAAPDAAAVPASCLDAYPNPFNPCTRIRYQVAESGADVELAVYDASGRRLATLAQGWREPGEYALDWRARDARGRDLPSGVYFVVLTGGEWEISRKLVLIR